MTQRAERDRCRRLRPDRTGRRISTLGAKAQDFAGDAALADAAIPDQDDASGPTIQQPLGAGDDLFASDQGRCRQHQTAGGIEQGLLIRIAGPLPKIESNLPERSSDTVRARSRRPILSRRWREPGRLCRCLSRPHSDRERLRAPHPGSSRRLWDQARSVGSDPGRVDGADPIRSGRPVSIPAPVCRSGRREQDEMSRRCSCRRRARTRPSDPGRSDDVADPKGIDHGFPRPTTDANAHDSCACGPLDHDPCLQ